MHSTEYQKKKKKKKKKNSIHSIVPEIHLAPIIYKEKKKENLYFLYIEIVASMLSIGAVLLHLENKRWDFLFCPSSMVSYWMGIQYFEWWMPS